MRRAFLLLLACVSLPAAAHQQSVSLGELTLAGDRVTGRLRFAGSDLEPLIHLQQTAEGEYTQSAIDAVRPALVHLILDEYAVSTPAGRCRLEPEIGRASCRERGEKGGGGGE